MTMRLSDETRLEGLGDRFGLRMDVQLIINRSNVVADGVDADPHLVGRGLVAESLGEEGEEAHLHPGEVGVQLLTDLKPNDDGGLTGNIYNPRDGRTYTAKVKLKSQDAMELSGCLLSVLCQSQTWTRVAEQRPQPRS